MQFTQKDVSCVFPSEQESRKRTWGQIQWLSSARLPRGKNNPSLLCSQRTSYKWSVFPLAGYWFGVYCQTPSTHRWDIWHTEVFLPLCLTTVRERLLYSVASDSFSVRWAAGEIYRGWSRRGPAGCQERGELRVLHQAGQDPQKPSPAKTTD